MSAGPAQNAFSAAVEWLDATLLGSVATAVAVIAVASVGFLLMSGRIHVRRAAQVILGCFILFGASSLAGGIVQATASGGAPGISADPPPPPAYPEIPASASGPASPYDPYAGAALPSR